jgi:hypothetical protein
MIPAQSRDLLYGSPCTSMLPSSVISASDHSLPAYAASSSSTSAPCGSTIEAPITRSASRSGRGCGRAAPSLSYRLRTGRGASIPFVRGIVIGAKNTILRTLTLILRHADAA